MDGFTHNQAARILGTTAAAMRKIKFLGIRPELGGKRWSDRQLLALMVRNIARRAGADPLAYQSALEQLSVCNLDAIRAACKRGKPYLRLMGPVADSRLVSESAAFHPDLLRAATESQTALVVVDIRALLDRIDGTSHDAAEVGQALGEEIGHAVG